MTPSPSRYRLLRTRRRARVSRYYAALNRPGVKSEEGERLKALERENRELRRANEILRKAAAFFAQAELDRRGT